MPPVALVMLALSSAAFAQPPVSLRDLAPLNFSMTAAAASDNESFQLFEGVDITFIPGVWMPRMRGHMTLGPSPAASPIDIERGFDLRDLEPTFLGELAITKHEKFSLLFTGFSFSTEGRGMFPFGGVFGDLTFAPGDSYATDFELTSFSGEIGIGVFRPFEALEGRPVDLRVSPIFVARYFDVDMSVTSGGATAKAEGEWLAPLAGLHVEVEFMPNRDIFLISGLTLEASLALGPALGGDGGFMYQVRAGVLVNVTENFGATFGYRLIDMDFDDDDFTLDTQLAGLFVGGVIRF